MSIAMRFRLAQNGEDLGGFARRIVAFNYAIRGANNTGKPITVLDAMARPGAAELWTVHPGIKEGSGAGLVLPPTRRKQGRSSPTRRKERLPEEDVSEGKDWDGADLAGVNPEDYGVEP